METRSLGNAHTQGLAPGAKQYMKCFFQLVGKFPLIWLIVLHEKDILHCSYIMKEATLAWWHSQDRPAKNRLLEIPIDGELSNVTTLIKQKPQNTFACELCMPMDWNSLHFV